MSFPIDMYMKKINNSWKLLLLFFILGEVSLSAQITSSPYSIFGLGTTEGNTCGVNSSMGGTGIALLSGSMSNLQNPASAAGLDSLLSIFEFGFSGKYTWYTNYRKHQSLFDANFRYINLAFRLSKRWAFSGGLTPYSSIGYNINVVTDIEGIDAKYTKTFTGDGGVNKVFLANAFKITDKLSLGINASYLFGTITHSELSTDYKYSLIDKIYISNINLDYGLNYRIKINETHYFLGITYNNGQTLKTSKATTLITSNSTETTKSTVDDLRVPRSYGIGVAFQKEFVRGALDYQTSRWSDLKFSNPLLRARNSNRFSVGLEMPASGNSRGTTKMIFYRFGAQYCESYMVIDGNPINYRSVSAGAGIPFKGYLNVVNLSLEAGQNGTTKGGLFKETFFSIHLDLSLKDLWFRKTKYY